MDEEHTQVVFPKEIVETPKWSDITIYSLAARNIISIIKLTVLLKENTLPMHTRVESVKY